MPSVPHYKGRIAEILLEGYQNAAARLICPAGAAPKPGQYLQVHQPNDPMEVVPTSLFAAGEVSRGSIERGSSGEISVPITGAIPNSWKPGTELSLRGPLGRGFELPKRARRVALVALDRNPGRLLPLVDRAIKQGAAISLFSDGPGESLPLVVEMQSLKELSSSGLRWADYLAADVSIEKAGELEIFFQSRLPAALAAEILVAAPMPCGGMAKCGVCTVRTPSGPRLACEDGPVFEIKELL